MRVLEGVTVVDFTQAYSGPYSTMQLADFGARVIKIERRVYGDQSRAWMPLNGRGKSGYFAVTNRGKESIALDLSKPEAVQIIKKLVKKADIVVENFKVGTLKKLGFGYEDLKKVNPEIIYASISGFGQNGEWSKYAAYDNVIQASCGMMELTGFADGVPTKVGPAIGDNFTGLTLALGIVMAYYHKLNTGKGQYLDVSMLDALFGMMERPVLHKTLLEEDFIRCGNREPALAPYDAFLCKDGYFTIGFNRESSWKNFCDAIGKSELTEDVRFKTNELRLENRDTLTAIIAEFCQDKKRNELEVIFDNYHIPNASVNTIPELINSRQLKVRDMLVKIEDEGVGTYFAMGNPVKMSTTPPVLKDGAPALGQATDRVLKELGYSKEDIRSLNEAGII